MFMHKSLVIVILYNLINTYLLFPIIVFEYLFSICLSLNDEVQPLRT